MPSEDTKILEFNQNQKSDKAPFIIYVDLQCMIEKIDGCKNNPENLSTTRVTEHIYSISFSMPTISSLKSIENKHDVCRRGDCMKKFCESLRKYTINRHDDKKCKTCRIKCKYYDCFLEYINFKDDLIEYKCLCCNNN